MHPGFILALANPPGGVLTSGVAIELPAGRGHPELPHPQQHFLFVFSCLPSI